jgi:hypothetical protein
VLNRRINVARMHECNLTGIDLEAFYLFRMFKGVAGPASEFEFHAEPLASEWIKLARYLRDFATSTEKNNSNKTGYE